jgi:hypothetical protein
MFQTSLSSNPDQDSHYLKLLYSKLLLSYGALIRVFQMLQQVLRSMLLIQILQKMTHLHIYPFTDHIVYAEVFKVNFRQHARIVLISV